MSRVPALSWRPPRDVMRLCNQDRHAKNEAMAKPVISAATIVSLVISTMAQRTDCSADYAFLKGFGVID